MTDQPDEPFPSPEETWPRLQEIENRWALVDEDEGRLWEMEPDARGAGARVIVPGYRVVADVYQPHDAEFIVQAHRDVAALLGGIRDLAQQFVRLKRQTDAMQDWMNLPPDPDGLR